MAIVVEEEKKPTNWFAILTVIVIIAVLFAGAYYLFFKKPELIEVVAPTSLQQIKELSGVSFDAKGVLESRTFRSLRQYGTTVTPPAAGRSNPFRPF